MMANTTDLVRFDSTNQTRRNFLWELTSRFKTPFFFCSILIMKSIFFLANIITRITLGIMMLCILVNLKYYKEIDDSSALLHFYGIMIHSLTMIAVGFLICISTGKESTFINRLISTISIILLFFVFALRKDDDITKLACPSTTQEFMKLKNSLSESLNLTNKNLTSETDEKINCNVTVIEDFSLFNSNRNNESFEILNEMKDLLNGKMCTAGEEIWSFELEYSIISLIVSVYEVFKRNSYWD